MRVALPVEPANLAEVQGLGVEEIMKKQTPKKGKSIVVARGKVGGRGTRANSCAGCAGAKFC